ncbi:MAG: helix-turn-helix domain-containing protein [Myxococcales bacterium]
MGSERTDAAIAELTGQIAVLTSAIESMKARLPPLLVSVQGAADHLGISVSTVRRMVRNRRLPHVRLGASIRVDLSRIRYEVSPAG